MKRLLLLAFAIVLCGQFALAQHTHDYASLEDRIDQSSLVVEGKVVRQESFHTRDKSAIYTRNFIEVSKVFKGQIGVEELYLTSMGGTVGNISYSAVCNPSKINVGLEGIFFAADGRHILLEEVPEPYNVGNDFILLHKGPGYVAFDDDHNYSNLTELYSEIQSYTGQSPTELAENSIEQEANLWAEEFVLTYASPDPGLAGVEYCLKNFKVKMPYVEFDITARSEVEGILFANTELELNYNKGTFGSGIVETNALSVNKETVIANSEYSLYATDLTKQKVSIVAKSSNNPKESQLFPLSKVEQLLCHIVLKVENPMVTPEIKLGQEVKTQYYNPSIDRFEDFDKVEVCNGLGGFMTGFTFSPAKLNAGKGDVLTITADAGFSFGTTEGYVLLRNTEQTDPLATSAWGRVKPHWVEWEEGEIRVTVPQGNVDPLMGFGTYPASGQVRVQLADLTTIYDSGETDLEIGYSIINQIDADLPEDRIINLEKNNGNDGYVFILGAALDAIPNAREVVERTLCDWAKLTNVNFTLAEGNVTNPERNKEDNLNTIFLSNDPSDFTFANATMETFHKKQTLGFLGGGGVGCAKDIDIVIREGANWSFSLEEVASGTGKLDFFSALIHEIGHAHSSWHAFAPGSDQIGDKLMYPILNPEINRRGIDEEAKAGGDFIMSTNSVISVMQNTDPMIPFSGTCVSATSEIEGVLNDFQVYPNPAADNINVEYVLEQPSTVRAKIVNTLGQVMQSENLGLQNSGHQLHQLPLQITSGAYLLILEIDDKIVINKFVK